MSQHLTIDEECEGVRQAWVNLKGDIPALAAYVYDRSSAYQGAHHDLWVKRLTEVALETVHGNVEAAQGLMLHHLQSVRSRLSTAEAAVESAGLEQDRMQTHISDLAEALAAVQAEGVSPETKALNRAKLDSALAVCLAMREFISGFQSRLEKILEQLEGSPHAG